MHLVGDSAGGGLVTMLAAILTNRRLLKELSEEVEEDIEKWAVPEVVRVVSAYGVVDQTGWRGTVMGVALGFCLRCYSPQDPVFGGRYTLTLTLI